MVITWLQWRRLSNVVGGNGGQVRQSSYAVYYKINGRGMGSADGSTLITPALDEGMKMVENTRIMHNIRSDNVHSSGDDPNLFIEVRQRRISALQQRHVR